MTTTTTEVQTFAASPALSVSLPPPALLPPAVRPAVETFQQARAAAVEASSAEQMIHDPGHDRIAAESDHKLLAAGKQPTHVAQLERDRATARARAIDARRALHECWYGETRSALAANRSEITAHAATAALAAVQRWREAVASLPPARDDLQVALHLVSFAQASTDAPSWTGNPQLGSATVGRVVVNPMTPHEVTSSLARGLDDVVVALEALASPQ